MESDEAIVRRIFPGERIKEIVCLSGCRHQNLKISFYNRPQAIVRIAKHAKNTNLAKLGYFGHTNSLEEEEKIIRKLKPILKEKVPTIIKSGTVFNRRFLAVSVLEGVELRKIKHLLTYHEIKKVLRSLGKTIGKIHLRAKPGRYGSVSGKGCCSWTQLWTQSIRQKLMCKNICSVFTQKELATIITYSNRMAKAKIDATDLNPALIIYDLHDANFMVNKDLEVCGLFDFDHTHFGLPQTEILPIQETCIEYSDHPVIREELKLALLEGYEAERSKSLTINPLINEMAWFNHYLYIALSKNELGKEWAGFSEIAKERAIKIAQGKGVVTESFFELRPEGAFLKPEYLPLITASSTT